MSRKGLYVSLICIIPLQMSKPLKRWWVFAEVVVVNNNIVRGLEQILPTVFICSKAAEFLQEMVLRQMRRLCKLLQIIDIAGAESNLS